jgi:putative endonuclease
MKYYTYILFSEELNKYYVGSTRDEIQERLRRHNSNHKGFTGGIGDWEIKYFEIFDELPKTRKRELQIKKWKSRIMIEKLIGV